MLLQYEWLYYLVHKVCYKSLLYSVQEILHKSSEAHAFSTNKIDISKFSTCTYAFPLSLDKWLFVCTHVHTHTDFSFPLLACNYIRHVNKMSKIIVITSICIIKTEKMSCQIQVVQFFY